MKLKLNDDEGDDRNDDGGEGDEEHNACNWNKQAETRTTIPQRLGRSRLLFPFSCEPDLTRIESN